MVAGVVSTASCTSLPTPILGIAKLPLRRAINLAVILRGAVELVHFQIFVEILLAAPSTLTFDIN